MSNTHKLFRVVTKRWVRHRNVRYETHTTGMLWWKHTVESTIDKPDVEVVESSRIFDSYEAAYAHMNEPLDGEYIRYEKSIDPFTAVEATQ